MRKFDEENNYHCQSLLTVPMLDHESELIGVLQLINKIDPQSKKIEAFRAPIKVHRGTGLAEAAIAMSTRELIFQLENLFESLVNFD